MSHVETNSDFVVMDLDCMEQCLEKHFPDLELIREQETYKWYGRWVNDFHGDSAAYRHGINPEDYGKCSHVIRDKTNPGGYEIGLVENPDEEVGGFIPILDTYGSGKQLMDKVGQKFSKMAQMYKLEGYAIQAEQKGFAFEWEWDGKRIEARLRDFTR